MSEAEEAPNPLVSAAPFDSDASEEMSNSRVQSTKSASPEKNEVPLERKVNNAAVLMIILVLLSFSEQMLPNC